MSDRIHLLPDSVANQIAAGEVIQRPAAVIKELVENAIDAGATEVKIFIKDAGRTLIHILDNGIGMSETDARMAFERHATSKIRNADDLFNLATMGFRGEALPSICAISRVELMSRTHDASIGTCLIINGSKVESQTPTMCEAGTSIMVKNLFFNTPARRKFLKSDNVELANIMREFERLALVNNNVKMSIDTGSRSIQLRPGSFRQRIGELWKNNLSMTLLPVEIDTALVKVEGFISRPEFARRRNALQFLIVNGRNMRHPYFHKAILSCYESLIASDTQPCYFLKFTVDPSTIDVNISPTKNEIKFENELQIRPLLVAAIRASLGKNGAVPSIDFDADPVEVDPLHPGEKAEIPQVVDSGNYNPFASDPSGSAGSGFTPSGFTPSGFGFSGFGYDSPQSRRRINRGAAPSAKGWDTLYADFFNQTSKALSEATEQEEARMKAPVIPEIVPEKSDEISSICLQYALKYIVTASREGVIIIDQHRAHMKIIYEDIMQRSETGAIPSQRVLFPEHISLDNAMAEAFHEVEPELRRLGFVLEEINDGEWAVTAHPASERPFDVRDTVMKILESVRDDSSEYGKEGSAETSLRSRVAQVMARASAIERGRRLSSEEMESIVARLFSLPDPAYTPYGRRIFTLFDESRLASLL